jgi:hypothetical protein
VIVTPDVVDPFVMLTIVAAEGFPGGKKFVPTSVTPLLVVPTVPVEGVGPDRMDGAVPFEPKKSVCVAHWTVWILNDTEDEAHPAVGVMFKVSVWAPPGAPVAEMSVTVPPDTEVIVG